jgi:hypothetical protein
MTISRSIRYTGIAGISGALLMFAGDMLLYGSFHSGAEFPEHSRILMGEIPLLRLMIGGAIGPVAALLYALGFWHVYLAVRDGGKVLAALIFSAFASMMTVGGTYHAGFVTTGLIVRAKNAAHEFDPGVMSTLLDQSDRYLLLLFRMSFVLGALATIMFLYTVLRKKTSYPKWMILFTPTLLIMTARLAVHIPAPVGSILYGGYINLSFLLFFCVSTVVLWTGTRTANARNKHAAPSHA